MIVPPYNINIASLDEPVKKYGEKRGEEIAVMLCYTQGITRTKQLLSHLLRIPRQFFHHLQDRDLRGEAKIAIKMALAAWLSWLVCTLLHQPQPIFAALVPLLALSGDPFNAVTSSVGRILGVFAGVLIGLWLVSFQLPLLLVVAIGLLAGTLLGIPMKVGNRANTQVAVSILFVAAWAQSGVVDVGIERMVETAIGSAIAIAVAILIWPPNPAHDLRYSLRRVSKKLVADLQQLAIQLRGDTGAILDEVRADAATAVQEELDIANARKALRWNPLRRKDIAAFDRVEARIHLTARMFRKTQSAARIIDDMPVGSYGSPMALSLADSIDNLARAVERAAAGEPYEAMLAQSEEYLDGLDPEKTDMIVLKAQLDRFVNDFADHDLPVTQEFQVVTV